MKNRKWFTFVELVVVVTILIILGTISFFAYTVQLVDSRNAVRLTDMGNIKMSLQNHKFKNGLYPLPGKPFNITNSQVIIQQWLLNEDVHTTEIIKKPMDPFVKNQYYFYSVTSNKLFFQIAMSLEDETLDNEMRAYVDGNYQTLNDNFVPSLVFATSEGWDIVTVSKKSILDRGTFNVPYDKNWNLINWGESLPLIIEENTINIPKFYWYYSCEEIYENGASMGSGVYNIMENWEITSTGCVMNINE